LFTFSLCLGKIEKKKNKGVGRGKESEMGVRGEESAWSTESVVWESDWSALTGICVLK